MSQYAFSNTLSNYALTSTANAQYAPSNTLSNYALTTTANAQYAPSNTLSNYTLTSVANTVYAPSNYTAYHWNSAQIGSWNYFAPAGSNMLYKIATLGATTDGANASLIEIKGVLGGFTSYDASLIDVCIGTRGGLSVRSLLQQPPATQLFLPIYRCTWKATTIIPCMSSVGDITSSILQSRVMDTKRPHCNRRSVRSLLLLTRRVRTFSRASYLTSSASL